MFPDISVPEGNNLRNGIADPAKPFRLGSE